MEHTRSFYWGNNYLFRGNYSSDKPPKLKCIRTISVRLATLVLFVCASILVKAQAPITGSGASTILDSLTFIGTPPDLTDPCTCAEDVNGTRIFNDEIIIQSSRANDVWMLIADNSIPTMPITPATAITQGVFAANSTTPIPIGTQIPLTGQTTDGMFIYSLDIAHRSGVGYSAVIGASAETADFYDQPENNGNNNGLYDDFDNTVSNICVQAVAGIDAFVPPNNILTLNASSSINITLSNDAPTNDLLSSSAPAAGIGTGVGETGSIYIGNSGNPTKILLQTGFDASANASLQFPNSIDLDADSILAIGAFNPLTDTLITFVYDADTALQAITSPTGVVIGPAPNFDLMIPAEILTDPGCVDMASTDVNWNRCNIEYAVGGITQKYDNQKRTFIICPNDADREVVKIAFTRFDIAVDDTLSIYEGVGTSGTLLDRSVNGGASATTTLSQTWFQAACTSTTGCLTVVFSPEDNNDNNNGTGFNFTATCETGNESITCPSDVVEAASCGANGSDVIAAIHTVQGLQDTCRVSPDIVQVLIDTTANATPGASPLANGLDNNVPMMAQGDFSSVNNNTDATAVSSENGIGVPQGQLNGGEGGFAIGSDDQYANVGLAGGISDVLVLDLGQTLDVGDTIKIEATARANTPFTGSLLVATSTDPNDFNNAPTTAYTTAEITGMGPGNDVIVDYIVTAPTRYVRFSRSVGAAGAVRIDNVSAITSRLNSVFLMPGNYTVTMIYDDVSGTDADPYDTCSYNLTVDSGVPVCNDQVNISLNSTSCSAILTPDMILEADGCSIGYTVNILTGPNAGTNTLTEASVGRTVRTEVVTPFGNRCWGDVLVEDKAGPIFTCPDTTIFCGISTDPSVSNLFPTDGSDCSLPITYQFSDSEPIPFGCTRTGVNLDTTAMIVRTWTAFDSNRMASLPCVQNIYIVKPNLSNAANIIWPQDTTFYCQSASTDPDYTLPAFSGYPSFVIGNDTVQLTQTCLFDLEMSDLNFTTDCEGNRKIQRTFSIIDWCNSGGFLVLQDPDPQIISVLDTMAPIISGMPDTLAHITSHGSCLADVILPAITVTDSCSPTNAAFRITGPSSTIFNQADTMRNVAFGTHTFTYIAEDGCGNQTRDSLSLTIKDTEAPTAIASTVAVTLSSGDDLTWVYATSFDGGSHDNCAIDSVLARIMGDTLFSTEVGFDCGNLGTVMVELRVVDECGNVSIAMSEVTVSDKNGFCNCNISSNIKPTDTSGSTNNDGAICQGDQVTLTVCADTITTTNSDTIVNDAIAAGYTLLWSDGITASPRSVDAAGRYFVTITAPNGCTAVDSIDITVDTIPIITILADQTICAGDSAQLGVLGGTAYAWTPTTGLSNATISAPRASPADTTTYTVVVSDGNGCTNIDSMVVNVNSSTVDAGLDVSVCVGETTILEAKASSMGTYLWTPNLFLDNNDTIASPEANPLMTTTYTVVFTDTSLTTRCTATDSVTVTVNDAPNASITVRETSGTTDNDGILCQGDQATLVGVGGTSYVWSNSETTDSIIITDAMTYSVTVTDANGCTNIATTTITVNTPPTVQPRTDTTLCPGDTITLTTTISSSSSVSVVWSPDSSLVDATTQSPRAFPDTTTKYFIVATDANGCSTTDSITITVFPQTSLSITPSLVEFPADVTQQFVAIIREGGTTSTIPDSRMQWSVGPTSGNAFLSSTTNDTITVNPMNNIGSFQLFGNATDANGCAIRDTAQFIVTAPTTPTMLALSGTIMTETGERVEGTTISLSGNDYDILPSITGTNGGYKFTVPSNNAYTVRPIKEENPLNGVSTFDLVLLSKHILGVTRLDSPYKLIAADVNRSGTITTYDIVELRKLILNINDNFPNNTSWRFIDATYEFKNPTNPLSETSPETYEITDLSSNMNWLDFIAIKIGDLNNSATTNSLTSPEPRNSIKSLKLYTKPTLSDDGELLIVNMNSEDFKSILGYQFTIEFDPSVMTFDKIIPTKLVGEEHFGITAIDRGILTTSWNAGRGIDLEKDAAIISIAFKMKEKVALDDVLKITSTKLQAEAYAESGEIMEVVLDDNRAVPEVASNKIKLYQNQPNPFTGTTTIRFYLPEATNASLRIFDTAGRIIKVYEGSFEKGNNELIIKSGELTKFGALYYQLATPTQIATKKMIHTR